MRTIAVGESKSVSKTITEYDVYSFAGICGDFNPVHVNKEAAKKSRFGKQVCHGQLVNSFISTVLGMYLPGPGTIYLEQNSKFILPVYIGDIITAVATVVEIKNKIVNLETNVFNQENTMVIKGNAVVMIGDYNCEN